MCMRSRRGASRLGVSGPADVVGCRPLRRGQRRKMAAMSSAGTPSPTSPSSPQDPGGTVRPWRTVGPAAALVLVALCLRGPFAAVGPVLGDVGDELSLSTGALAVVTSLPLVCFGLLSPVAPALAARLGLHRAVLAGTAVIVVG